MGSHERSTSIIIVQLLWCNLFLTTIPYHIHYLFQKGEKNPSLKFESLQNCRCKQVFLILSNCWQFIKKWGKSSIYILHKRHNLSETLFLQFKLIELPLHSIIKLYYLYPFLNQFSSDTSFLWFLNNCRVLLFCMLLSHILLSYQLIFFFIIPILRNSISEIDNSISLMWFRTSLR